jgi:hypothetical protein
VSVAFLLGDPGWIYDSSRRLGLSSVVVWPVLIVAAAAPLFFANDRKRALAMTGGLVSLGSLAVSTVPQLGPGIEEALLVSASLGAAMIVAAGLDSFSREPFAIIAALGAVAILVVSVGDLGNGRLGLSSGDVNERLSFATTLADDDGPGRILHAAVDPALIPGEMRSGPGFFYRLLDGQGTTLDEVWLPEQQAEPICDREPPSPRLQSIGWCSKAHSSSSTRSS